TLFAAGAAAASLLAKRLSLVVNLSAATVLLLAGLISLPMGLPILPPEQMAKYCRALGLTAPITTNRGTVLPLPQDYADMLGWKEQAEAVAAAYKSLPATKQATTGFIAGNDGEAGAIEFYGPRFGLPSRIMLPDNFLLWPADTSCDVVV